MAKTLAVITVHGMGETRRNYADELQGKLKSELGNKHSKVHFGAVYYQDVLQPNEEEYFAAAESKLDYKKYRRWVLYGFGDAGALEYSRFRDDGAYERAQREIFREVERALEHVDGPETPIVIVAQSLGCQVVTNYIWDAHRTIKPNYGLWRHDHSQYPDADLEYLKLGTARFLATTGCNIPIFIAGLPKAQRMPIDKPNALFEWHNYFDEDDLLGWPLSELNTDYAALVDDIPVNAGNIFRAWNPFSHTDYWGDPDVYKPIADKIRLAIG